jgi:hypothetical protein
LTKRTGAVTTLSAKIMQLASTVAEVNAHLRGRLALDGAEDGSATLTDPEQPEPLPAPRRNGRKKVEAEAE